MCSALLHFNDALRALRAAEFAQLLARGGVRQMVVGHDFRAGYRGEASAEWFQHEGPRAWDSPSMWWSPCWARACASAAARSAPRWRRATSKLQRACWAGPIPCAGGWSAGERLGRTLGFPTANLRLARRRTPLDGIFAVRVRGSSHRQDCGLGGVASLGTRPTVGGVVPLLEVHVFDFAGDLYGRELEVEFVARLRDELRFDNVDAMVEQMHRDAAAGAQALAASLTERWIEWLTTRVR